MSIIRRAIDNAVAEAMAEHPKYFTPKGLESARAMIVRKVMAALRDGGGDKSATESAGPETPQFVMVTAESREARAYTNLRQLAGAVAPTHVSDGGVALFPPANCEAVFALADLPPKDEWLFIANRQQIGAWTEFFRETLPGVARRSILQDRNGESGILMPGAWPPSKDGKTYTPEAA